MPLETILLLLCCSNLTPYKASNADYEPHFSAFMSFATVGALNVKLDGTSTDDKAIAMPVDKGVASYAIQLIKKRIVSGPLDSPRYFFAGHNLEKREDWGKVPREYTEVEERHLIALDFHKIDASKIFTCVDSTHPWSFELNVWERKLEE